MDIKDCLQIVAMAVMAAIVSELVPRRSSDLEPVIVGACVMTAIAVVALHAPAQAVMSFVMAWSAWIRST
jgi:hypothetical protein